MVYSVFQPLSGIAYIVPCTLPLAKTVNESRSGAMPEPIPPMVSPKESRTLAGNSPKPTTPLLVYVFPLQVTCVAIGANVAERHVEADADAETADGCAEACEDAEPEAVLLEATRVEACEDPAADDERAEACEHTGDEAADTKAAELEATTEMPELEAMVERPELGTDETTREDEDTIVGNASLTDEYAESEDVKLE